jgi:hypothetical protein
MSKKPSAAESKLIELAEAMLQELGSLRMQGSGAYPPRLSQLAKRVGGTPTDDQIMKAAAKTMFTAKAVVPEKVNKKPSLDSPVYFKGDVPKPEQELATRMLLVLEAQRKLGADAYPPTLRRLAELCEWKASNTLVTKAASHATMTEQAVVLAGAKTKPSLDAPVVLKDDVEGDFSAVLPALLRFALSPVTTSVKKKPAVTNAFTLAELKKRFVSDRQESIGDAVKRGIERLDLPSDVAWVWIKGEPKLFLMENLRPGAPSLPSMADGQAPEPPPSVHFETPPAPVRPARDFAEAFREAFDRLDRRNGSTDFVKLSDLRQALAAYSREAFDAGLRQLREAGQFTLDSHEGLHGSLTPEEREAGVREAGSLLIYASRR